LQNKNFLICLVGLPSSGKTTFANALEIALKKKFLNLDVKIIDPDIIRQKLTPDNFDPEKEQIVRNKNLETIKKELKRGYIVISDDLNYYSSMRQNLKGIADSLKLNFFIIHIATPLDICIKWNEKRGVPIPNVVINKIQEKFDNFNKYNWERPIAKYDLSVISDLNFKIKELLDRLDNKMTSINQKLIKERISITNRYNENLDKITRNYIGTLILNPVFVNLKRKVIKLRKSYVKTYKNKNYTEEEILKNFKAYIKKNLNVKIS